MNVLQHQNRDAFLGSSLISSPGDRLSPRDMDDYYGWQYIDYFGISSNKWFGGVKLRLERFSEKP